MNSNNAVKAVCFGFLLLALCAGCSWSIGGTKQAPSGSHYSQPTKGQELLDLQRAHDQGSISDAEYEEQKAKILRR